MSTLVSVITICRNAEDCIEPTMLSVLQQTYENIEYLVVDGQSSDRTLQVVADVCRRFPLRKVRVISEPDDGISDAMNKGIRNSTGEIIAHLHAGDRYVGPTVIERVVASFVSCHWRWAVADSIVVGPDGNPMHRYRPCPDRRMLLKKNCIPHQSAFLVRDLFDRHGLFRTDLKQAMDYEFWLRMAFLGGESFVLLPFAATYYASGGRSSRILELLRYLWRIRRDASRYGVEQSVACDILFAARVAAFWVWEKALLRVHHASG